VLIQKTARYMTPETCGGQELGAARGRPGQPDGRCSGRCTRSTTTLNRCHLELRRAQASILTNHGRTGFSAPTDAGAQLPSRAGQGALEPGRFPPPAKEYSKDPARLKGRRSWLFSAGGYGPAFRGLGVLDETARPAPGRVISDSISSVHRDQAARNQAVRGGQGSIEARLRQRAGRKALSRARRAVQQFVYNRPWPETGGRQVQAAVCMMSTA